MKLCLVRHGNAIDHENDSLRNLSQKGISEARATGEFLKELDLNPKIIFHSHLYRAKETAENIRKILGQETHLEEDANLLPYSPTSTWVNNLYYHNENLIIVGHMPYLGLLAEEYLNKIINFPTGGALILELDDLNGKVITSNFPFL